MRDLNLRKRVRALQPSLQFGLALFVIILLVNLFTNGRTFAPANLPVQLGLAAPLLLIAMASTPSILVGNGGIDISLGPVMSLANAVVVQALITDRKIESPVVLVLAAVATGTLIGMLNGVVIAYLRIQPIVATLGSYLVCAGLTLVIAPTPGGSIPPWLASLAGTWSILPILAALVVWWGFRQLPFYGYLMATGGDERAVYSSGIDTAVVRVGAYTLGGLFAGIAGLSLSAVLGSVDPNVGPTYTMTGLAAVALGGVSLAGGVGGMGRALLGGGTLFLLLNVLTYLRVSPFLLQVAFGLVLVVAVAANGGLTILRKERI